MSVGFWALAAKWMFRGVLGHVGTRPNELETVTFPSADGSRLEGMIASASRAPVGVAVLCHPFTRHGYEFFLRGPVVASLRDAGLHVVLFNFKGFGRSEFRGANFADDVVGAVDHARGRFPELPIAILGLSFGGFQAAGALVRLDGKVAAAVFDSVPLSPSDFFRTGVTAPVMRWLGGSRWAAVTGTESLAGKLRVITRTRTCFIYGGRDELADLAAVQAAAAGRSNVELVTLPHLGHLEAFKQHSKQYLDLICSKLAVGATARARTGV